MSRAVLVKARTIDGDHLVEYRLPRSVDPSRRRYSARVDATTYQQARESDVLLVRVVPGKPSANRPVGEVDNSLFAVVAVAADVVLLVVGVLLWRRWLRSSRHEVVAVAETRSPWSRAVTRSPLPPRPDGCPGCSPASGSPAPCTSSLTRRCSRVSRLSGLEQVHGSAYVVRGRVVDARVGRVELELDDGFRLSVETGTHRIRADIRDSTEVRGTLCFTPAVRGPEPAARQAGAAQPSAVVVEVSRARRAFDSVRLQVRLDRPAGPQGAASVHAYAPAPGVLLPHGHHACLDVGVRRIALEPRQLVRVGR